MRKMATDISLKLNLSLNTPQSPSSSPSPNDFFNNILILLNEWLAFLPNLFHGLVDKFNVAFAFLPNLFHGLVDKFNEAFPPEKRAHWLAVATPFAIAALGVVLAFLLCYYCFLPAIVSCIGWVLVTCWNLVKGLFMLVWRACVLVYRTCCCCGATSVKMMKAPGTGGNVIMPRSVFESSPKLYFSNLRAGNLVLK